MTVSLLMPPRLETLMLRAVLVLEPPVAPWSLATYGSVAVPWELVLTGGALATGGSVFVPWELVTTGESVFVPMLTLPLSAVSDCWGSAIANCPAFRRSFAFSASIIACSVADKYPAAYATFSPKIVPDSDAPELFSPAPNPDPAAVIAEDVKPTTAPPMPPATVPATVPTALPPWYEASTMAGAYRTTVFATSSSVLDELFANSLITTSKSSFDA